MYPAPSVIIFSVCSGMGFGLLAMLGFGFAGATGLAAFLWWGLGYGLAVIGLLASTFHLGNPRNAIKAFSQWRSSWLSREGIASVAALLLLAPMALSDWLDLGWWRGFGCIGAVLALFTVFTTGMIYAQIKAVPRWHHALTPAMFLTFALAGGTLLAGLWVALPLIWAVGAVLLAYWWVGDGQFARARQSMASATGLEGDISVFERGHTAGNYLLREMIHVVGRKHAQKLRVIAIGLGVALPSLLLVLIPAPISFALAAISHLVGAFAARWLFFAEAEHVVGLYYGAR